MNIFKLLRQFQTGITFKLKWIYHVFFFFIDDGTNTAKALKTANFITEVVDKLFVRGIENNPFHMNSSWIVNIPLLLI